jgi:AcrR family transcriptional regulator
MSAVPDRVMGAAGPVFAERGVDATTVEDLLRAAGISRRSFYLHFHGKDEVLAELYRVASDGLVVAVSARAAKSGSASDALRAIVDVFMDIHLSQSRLIALLRREAARPESPLAALHDDCEQRIASIICKATGASDELAVMPVVWLLERASAWLLRAGAPDCRELERVRELMHEVSQGCLRRTRARADRDR